jgi:hypothetical protein
MDSTMPAVNIEGFEATTQAHADGRLTVRLVGNADGAARDAFASFLKQLYATIVRLASATVDFDVGQLYFANGACFRCLWHFVAETRSLAAKKRFKVRILTSSSLWWQYRYFRDLTIVGQGIVSFATPEDAPGSTCSPPRAGRPVSSPAASTGRSLRPRRASPRLLPGG